MTIKPYQLKRVHGCTLFGVDGLALDLMRLFAEAHEGEPKLRGKGIAGNELLTELRFELGVAVFEDGRDRAMQVEVNLWDFPDKDIFVAWVVGEQRLLLLRLLLGLRGGGWGVTIVVSHDSTPVVLDWLVGV